MTISIRVQAASLFVALSLIPVCASAATMRAGEQPNVPASERIGDDLYMAGGNVSSSGALMGDLVVVGGNILINSAVAQDVAAGGGSITILGTVGDDVRVVGGNIIIGGGVKGDVVAAGGQTQISGSGVGGDVVWAGGSLSIDAPVVGNLKLAGDEAAIYSTIHGNVEFHGSKLTLGKGAVIDGNLTYESPKAAVMEDGAVVRGATEYKPQEVKEFKEKAAKGVLAILSFLVLGKFLSMLAFALALGLGFHRYSTTLVRNAFADPLSEAGRGLVVLIVLPVVSVLLLCTLIGIPFGILGLLSFAALMLVASSLVAILLGSLVHAWVYKPAEYHVTWKTILAGVALSMVLAVVPVVGGFALFFLFLLALGSSTKIKWSAAKEWR